MCRVSGFIKCEEWVGQGLKQLQITKTNIKNQQKDSNSHSLYFSIISRKKGS